MAESIQLQTNLFNIVWNQGCRCTRLDEMGEDLPEFLILGGDTNTVFNSLDKEGGNQNFKVEAINAFERLKQKFSLIDTFRGKNPYTKDFTWDEPKNNQGTNDMFFISSTLQDFVMETGIIPSHKTCSDHGIPFVKLSGLKFQPEVLGCGNSVTSCCQIVDSNLK